MPPQIILFVFIFLVLFIATMIVVSVDSYAVNQDLVADCEALGGHPITDREGRLLVCIDSGAFIDLNGNE